MEQLTGQVPSDEQIVATFKRDGFVGPFDGLEPSVLAGVRGALERIFARNSMHPVYNRPSGRDWHLVERSFMDAFTSAPILKVLRALLGQNLMVWRSQIFNKEPGVGELKWHQARLFTGREFGRNRPSLELPSWATDYSDWFNVTCWFAVDDATPENGAVRIVPGTQHNRYDTKPVPFADSVFGAVVNSYYEAAQDDKKLDELRQTTGYEFAFDPVKEGREIRTMAMRGGQFFVFNERTMHSSGPNVSNTRRLGINFRTTTPDVRIYPMRDTDDPSDGQGYDIRNHRCVLISGVDEHNVNPWIPSSAVGATTSAAAAL